MPVKKCTINGKSGYKWGDSGVCYTGPDAMDKAKKQGLAALASEAKSYGSSTKDEINEYIKSKMQDLR